MPQITVGLDLEKNIIYDLQSELLDPDGMAVALGEGESLLLQNIGNGEIRTFEAASKPANIDGLFPLELQPGQDRRFSIASGQSVFVFSPFRSGKIAVTGA